MAGARRLCKAVDRDALTHLIYVSIVGVDVNPYGYYRAKFAAEQVFLGSGLPVTVVRATQFHSFVDDMLRMARRGPVLPVPSGWQFAPVARRRGGRPPRERAGPSADRPGARVRWSRAAEQRGYRSPLGAHAAASSPGAAAVAAGQGEQGLPRRQRSAWRGPRRAWRGRAGPPDLQPAPCVRCGQVIRVGRKPDKPRSRGRALALVLVVGTAIVVVGAGTPWGSLFRPATTSQPMLSSAGRGTSGSS